MMPNSPQSANPIAEAGLGTQDPAGDSGELSNRTVHMHDRPGQPRRTGNKPGSTTVMDSVSVVERIRSGDQSAVEELYLTICRGIRFIVYRHLGANDSDDRVHDIFLIVLEAIQNGHIRNPERLMSYVLTVTRRQVACQIARVADTRKNYVNFDEGSSHPACRRAGPEEALLCREELDIAAQALRRVPDREREILTRFYLKGQSPVEICQEMNLTETQFRLAKWRAKMVFSKVGQRRLQRRPPQ